MHDDSGVRLASAVMLYRPCPSPPGNAGQSDRLCEFLMVRRSPKARFFPNAWAFPGGKADSGDREFLARWGAEAAGGWGTDPLAIAAVRELWEELGVPLVTPLPPPRAVDQVRNALLEGIEFEAALGGAGLSPPSVRPVPLRGAGKLVTPHFHPLRFATRFYILAYPPAAGGEASQPKADAPANGWPQPNLWGEELADLAWVTPPKVLEEWQAGKAHFPPPIQHLLSYLARLGPVMGARELERHLERPRHRWFLPRFTPQVAGHDVATATLPPARHTTCWLLGQERIVAVDPGSADPTEQEKLVSQIELLEGQTGGKLALTVLTHHHADHVSGAAALAEARNIEVAAHPLTAEIVAREAGLEVNRKLEEGDWLRLAGGGGDELIVKTADGAPTAAPPANPAKGAPAANSSPSAIPTNAPALWQVLHTPGHSPGHICLWQPAARLAVCGDMVSAFGWVQVRPPRGDMAAYMASLERLAGLGPPQGPASATAPAASPSATPAKGPALLFPGHGPALPARKTLARFLAHRQEREAKVLTALGAPPEGPAGGLPPLSTHRQKIEELLPRVYEDTPRELWHLAKESLLAHLLKLEGEGRVAGDGEGRWSLRQES